MFCMLKVIRGSLMVRGIQAGSAWTNLNRAYFTLKKWAVAKNLSIRCHEIGYIRWFVVNLYIIQN